MGLKAEVQFAGFIFKTMVVFRQMHQVVDNVGKPFGRPAGHLVDLVFESTQETTEFLAWLLSQNMKEIKIMFSPVTGNGKSRTIWLRDAHCIHFSEHFISTTTQPLTTTVTISAGIVDDGGVIHYEYWKVSDITPPKKVEPTPVPREKKPKKKKKDFDITIKHLKTKKTFIPLGIPAYSGTHENKFIEFEIEVNKNAVESFEIQILHNGSNIYTAHSDEDGLPSNYGVGKHTFKWDGFNNSGKYDSKVFSKGKFKAKVTGTLEGVTKNAESEEFSFKRTEEKWVDAIIDKVSKRIDITLHVNLRDGGEKGTEKDCQTVGSGSYASERKVCPWDDIPEEVIKNNLQEPIKTRTKSFEELRDMALEGINRYWSRRYSNTKGTLADGTNYEVIVSAIQDKGGMKAPKVIYFTNSKETNFTRSHNWELSRKLFYHIGYLKDGGIWNYTYENKSNSNFIETSAHEIGHEILLAYGGQLYSKEHKGSSTLGQDYLPNTPYPKTGEIDLMKYYFEVSPHDYKNRVVASESDILSLVWLTKMKIK